MIDQQSSRASLLRLPTEMEAPPADAEGAVILPPKDLRNVGAESADDGASPTLKVIAFVSSPPPTSTSELRIWTNSLHFRRVLDVQNSDGAFSAPSMPLIARQGFFFSASIEIHKIDTRREKRSEKRGNLAQLLKLVLFVDFRIIAVIFVLSFRRTTYQFS